MVDISKVTGLFFQQHRHHWAPCGLVDAILHRDRTISPWSNLLQPGSPGEHQQKLLNK